MSRSTFVWRLLRFGSPATWASTFLPKKSLLLTNQNSRTSQTILVSRDKYWHPWIMACLPKFLMACLPKFKLNKIYPCKIASSKCLYIYIYIMRVGMSERAREIPPFEHGQFCFRVICLTTLQIFCCCWTHPLLFCVNCELNHPVNTQTSY